jgi:hypothetical protein
MKDANAATPSSDGGSHTWECNEDQTMCCATDGSECIACDESLGTCCSSEGTCWEKDGSGNYEEICS